MAEPKRKSEDFNKILSGPDPGSLKSILNDLQQLSPRLTDRLPERMNVDRENLERGLAQLVLTIIELLRQLMERQAVRRMEADTLTEDEVERLGQTFMCLQQRMDELKKTFGLEDKDLNLDLGPLGKLL